MPTAGSYDFGSTDLPGGKPFPISSIGTLPGSSGSSSSDGSSGVGTDWAGIAGAGAGLLGALFAPKNGDASAAIKNVQAQSGSLNTAGKASVGEGQAALDPVLQYFKALASGDPSQALAATAPQRGRVIDQYDAARRSAGQFTPRGGGQASTQQESRTKEAGDLANVTSTARSDATKELASVGTNLTQQGISEQEASVNAMVSTLGPLLQQQQQQGNSVASIFKGVGELAAAFLV